VLTAPRDAEVSLPCPSTTDEVVSAWTVHLLRGRAARLPRILVCAAFVLVCGLLLFHNPLLASLPVLALLLSLSEFLFPVRYTLTRRGAWARHGLMTLEIAWADVRHAYLAPDGIKLSPIVKPNARLEPLRGVFLRFAGNEEAVIAAVRRLREEASADA